MLSRKKKYLQIALNSTLSEAYSIIRSLPPSDRILIEAGTPLIKSCGSDGIANIYSWWSQKLTPLGLSPYIVADLKCMDRGSTEVAIARQAGASAAVALGLAPVETIDAFIDTCRQQNIDSMLDMMNVDYPVKYLRMLKKMPTVIILHRGVDESEFNKSKPIPYIQINKVRSSFDTMISIAGGDTIREVQRGVFNGADIVVVWKEFYQVSGHTGTLAEEFLLQIK
jgi:3-keto-L-gulonate-6-phosphate decarboxylase